MRKSKEEILLALKGLLGENTTDEAITVLEDVSDSLPEVDTSEYDAKIATLEQQVKDTEESWRKRYTERFFSAETNPILAKNEQEEDVKEDGEVKTFDELFTES